MNRQSTPPKPLVTYAALVGKMLAYHREKRGITQAAVANALKLSQSAYSRLEAGDSVLNVAQLRIASAEIGLTAQQVLAAADQYEQQLRQHGVQVVVEKQANPAAVMIGLGLLAALLLSRS